MSPELEVVKLRIARKPSASPPAGARGQHALRHARIRGLNGQWLPVDHLGRDDQVGFRVLGDDLVAYRREVAVVE